MDCKTIHQDLIFYLDNELPNERRIIVQEHLNECIECREFLALLKSEMQIISDEKNPEVSPFFFTRLSARLEEKQGYQPQSQWIRFVQPAFFSLILAIGIYGGLKIGSNASDTTTNQPVTRNIQMMDDFEAEPIESFLLEKL